MSGPLRSGMRSINDPAINPKPIIEKPNPNPTCMGQPVAVVGRHTASAIITGPRAADSAMAIAIGGWRSDRYQRHTAADHIR